MRITVGNETGVSYVESKLNVSFLYTIEQPVVTKENLNRVESDTVDSETKIIGRNINYVPEKIPYANEDGQEGLIIKFGEQGLAYMNYNSGGAIYSDLYDYRKYGLSTVPAKDYISGVSVYKKEIWYDENDVDSNGNPKVKEEENYHLVTSVSNSRTIYDFNIANNRYYKYLFRFVYTGSDINKGKLIESLNEIIVPVKTSWMGWTLTELHTVDNNTSGAKEPKVYSASLKDVWKFKYNISPGDYQHNLSKTKQDTLAAYPKFVHGPTNAISGQVSCLLGRDILPFDWSNKSYAYGRKYNEETGKYEWGWQWAYNQGKSCSQNPLYYIENGEKKNLNSTYAGLFNPNARNSGGYLEELWPQVGYEGKTSNKQLDMLNKWQQFCYSGNPKLLKDALGNKYIVQVHDTSFHTEETWERKPITITFSWTQIGDADDYQILQEED